MFVCCRDDRSVVFRLNGKCCLNCLGCALRRCPGKTQPECRLAVLPSVDCMGLPLPQPPCPSWEESLGNCGKSVVFGIRQNELELRLFFLTSYVPLGK